MEILVLTDSRCALHYAGVGHPERPERLSFAMDAVATAMNKSAASLRIIDRIQPIDPARLTTVHSPEYVKRILELSGRSGTLDPDTHICPSSVDAARIAASGAVDAVAAVVRGEAAGALCIIRPPGHHACSNRAMGFCLFNNAAVAAAAALTDHGCRRVLILDCDVHHGNGTQQIFYEREDVLYVSLHQYPWYPWSTGGVAEVGVGPGYGFTVNVPLPAGCGDAEYAFAMEEVVLRSIRTYRPDLVIVSAGFDTHVDDPLAEMRLTNEGLCDLSGRLYGVLKELDIPWTAVLEGGYAQSAIRDGIGSLLSPNKPSPTLLDLADEAARVAVDRTLSYAFLLRSKE